uniref:esterase OVCA2 isoform X2 n=1 Tax=Pristiophorus japonicus TaxID=55135 RepID=UPI00398E86E0
MTELCGKSRHANDFCIIFLTTRGRGPGRGGRKCRTALINVWQSARDNDYDHGIQAGETEENARGWWFSNPGEESFNALDHVETCKGLEESLETVSKAMVELGPFDGIMGFSQGAALVSMICALKQQGDSRFQFDFAILIAGFRSRCKLHERFYEEPIALPSLHVFGDTDRVIPGAMSQELSTLFMDPVILTHPGGHFVPASAPQKKVYLEFLERFQKK